MLVVAYTSPLNYLILIEEIRLLPEMYRVVYVPELVLEELRHQDAPELVKHWTSNLPHWVNVSNFELSPPEPELAALDKGEAAAISLAMTSVNVLLLMDETLGRAEAARRQIRTIGTLGILRDASILGLVELEIAFAKLQNTSFRAPVSVMEELLKLDKERRRSHS